MALGEPEKINIIELGPGRGTLMKDILTVAAKFPKFERAISVHLVELSETMRDVQRETLGCSSNPVSPHTDSSSLLSNPNSFDAQEVLERDKEQRQPRCGNGVLAYLPVVFLSIGITLLISCPMIATLPA